MPIPRIFHLFLAVCVAAVALAACKGSSGVTGATALLRIVQGNPALGSIDYQIDAGGALFTGAAPPVVQPFQIVSAASHTILFFTSGTTNKTTPAQCVTPTLTSGGHYTMVVVNTSVLTSGCMIFQEPVAPNGTVVYHNATTVGGSATTVFPVFCTPAGATPGPVPQPCTNVAVQNNPVSSPAVAGSAVVSGTPVTVGVNFGTATSGAGIAFTAAASATSTVPLCYSATADPPSDPTLYPVTIDPTDTTNFVPNGSSDLTFAIFITDGPTQTGANACPIALSGSTAL